jgi:ribonuclease HII
MVLCSFFGIAGMVVLAGIDEAGFGPILGPLVVSSSAFSLPQHLLTADLWQVLKKSVGNKRKHLAGRLLIADSKKVYSKSLGIKHLERSVLACLRCLGKEPCTLTELVELLCPNCLEQLGDYPWYKDAGGFRLSANCADRAIASSVLANDLTSNGIELLELKSYCLEVAHYNKMVGTVKNKASVLFTATSVLIKNVFDNFAGDDLQIILDRQGGRVHYRKALQLMFPDMEMKIIRESQTVSSYEMETGGKHIRLHFVVGADDHYLPVSLASMVSKYIRELLIGCMNRYFAGFHPGLRPTAGYWKDGLRFIEDLKTHLPHIQIDSNQLIRCR